jgi:hypothetical protein
MTTAKGFCFEHSLTYVIIIMSARGDRQRGRGAGPQPDQAPRRVGSIVASLIIGFMIGAHLEIISVFILLAVGSVIAAFAVVVLTHETGGMSLDEIESSIID